MIEFSSSDEKPAEVEDPSPAPKRARPNPVVEPSPTPRRARPNFVRVRADVREANPNVPVETLSFDITLSQRVQVKDYPFMLEAVSLSTVELVANDNLTARWATRMEDWTYDKADPVTVRDGREGSFKHADRKVTVDVAIVAI